MADDFGSIIELLEKQKAAIDKALSALRDIGGTAAPASIAASEPTAKAEPTRGRKRISDEARERMRLGQQRRYAHLHKSEAEPAPVATKKPKFSPEGLKKLALAMKKRWAAKRTASAVKKTAVKKGRKKSAADEVPF
jgi:hypothetical protein